MKRSVFILVFTIFAAFAAPAQVNVGMTDTASYYPLLRGLFAGESCHQHDFR